MNNRRRSRAATPNLSAFVRQRSGNDCAVAAVAMMLTHHGHVIDYKSLAVLLNPSHQGTSMLQIAAAVRQLGFLAFGFKGPYGIIQAELLPAIAHVVHRSGAGHFVVLHSCSPSTIAFADPSAGLRIWSRNTFIRRWSGHFLTIRPTPLSRLHLSAALIERSATATIVSTPRDHTVAIRRI
jgi:ABC-type bacteriocin/lantibiotic exporter with double-glycine peptidase domain